MSPHHAWSLARIYCGRAWIVTMVMNIAIYDSCNKWKRFEKIVSTALYYFESLQTFSGPESFQLQLNSKNKLFPYFFFVSLYAALWSVQSLITTISSAYHSNFLPSDQTIFLGQTSRLGHGTRPHLQPIRWSAPDQTITPDNQMSLRSRPQIRPCTNSHTRPLSARPPKSAYQIRPPPPHQTTRISTAHPASWHGTGQVHCLWVG